MQNNRQYKKKTADRIRGDRPAVCNSLLILMVVCSGYLSHLSHVSHTCLSHPSLSSKVAELPGLCCRSVGTALSTSECGRRQPAQLQERRWLSTPAPGLFRWSVSVPA